MAQTNEIMAGKIYTNGEFKIVIKKVTEKSVMYQFYNDGSTMIWKKGLKKFIAQNWVLAE